MAKISGNICYVNVMGHLVNPIGLRLGMLDSWVWEDFWCVKGLYYSEYMHSIYSMREVLEFVFDSQLVSNIGLLYSHFSFYKKLGEFYIYIVIYDGPSEEWMKWRLDHFLKNGSLLGNFYSMLVGKFSYPDSHHSSLLVYNLAVRGMKMDRRKKLWNRKKSGRYSSFKNSVNNSKNFEDSGDICVEKSSVLHLSWSQKNSWYYNKWWSSKSSSARLDVNNCDKWGNLLDKQQYLWEHSEYAKIHGRWWWEKLGLKQYYVSYGQNQKFCDSPSQLKWEHQKSKYFSGKQNLYGVRSYNLRDNLMVMRYSLKSKEKMIYHGLSSLSVQWRDCLNKFEDFVPDSLVTSGMIASALYSNKMPRLRKGNSFQGKAFYYLSFAAGKEVKVTSHEKSFSLRMGKHLEICSGRFLQFSRLQLKNMQLSFLRFSRMQLSYSQLQHMQLSTSQLYTSYSRLSYRSLSYLKCLRFSRLRMSRLRFSYLQASYWSLEHFFSDYKPFSFGHLDFLSKKWQSLGVSHFRPVDYSLSQFKGYPQDSVSRTVLRESYIRFVPNSYLGILLKSGNTSSVNISAGKVHIFPFLSDWQGVSFRWFIMYSFHKVSMVSIWKYSFYTFGSLYSWSGWKEADKIYSLSFLKLFSFSGFGKQYASRMWDQDFLSGPSVFTKFSAKFEGMRVILNDKLLSNTSRLFLFKVVLGKCFLQGFSVWMMKEMQNYFFFSFSSWISTLYLDWPGSLKTKLMFLGLHNGEVTASMLTRYFSMRLDQSYSLWEIVHPVRRELSDLSSLLYGKMKGFKFYFSGRFTSKQSAMATWVISGKVPFNKLSVSLDYSCSEVVLVNSSCSMSVWLYRAKDFKNYSYNLILNL